jgi:hypothetical protein
MNRAQVSLFVFGLYMVFVVGFGFMVIPKFVLETFELTAGDDVWIRFVGMLASIIGIYYILAARAGLDRFFPWTVPGRYYAGAFMIFFAASGRIGAAMYLFAAVDIAAASWTWWAVRSDKA